MSRKKWCANKSNKDLANRLSDRHNIDPFTALLLISRGITEDKQIESFFAEDNLFCNPFDIKDMDKAVERILYAIDNEEKIAIYGDYDADGVTATSILYMFFEMLGADVIAYIPDRNTEGYGLNNAAIDKLCQDSVKLIVTVDNGVSAINEAEYIYKQGMELVVTDHHKVGKALPKAAAVVNPHRVDNTSQFKDWSGVGIAFKLICALSDGDYEEALDAFSDIIAIGTIGDVVPLLGENRALVKFGLEKINRGESIAVQMLRTSYSTDKKLNATSLAFSVVPRINAIGRVSHAINAFKLLTSPGGNDAEELARQAEEANAERQRLEQEILSGAQKQLQEHPEILYDRVLIFNGRDWHAGVIGIVASRFVDRFGKPCIVISDNGDTARGSARSIDGFSLFEAISSCSTLLTHFGGHTLAAGFSLLSENIPAFKKAMSDYTKTVQMPFPCLKLDCRLKPEFISADVLPIIDALEPFGAGNPQPLFGLYSMSLVAIQPIGGGKHLRLSFNRGSANITALKFGTTAEDFPYQVGDNLDLAVCLEKNEYMGNVKVSVLIKDIRFSSTDDEAYLKSVRLYEKIKRGEYINQKQAAFILPDRAFVAKVYRYILSIGGWRFDTDILCCRLGVDLAQACKVLVSIDVLCDLGVFSKDSTDIYVSNTSAKVNLDDAEILSTIKSYL